MEKSGITKNIQAYLDSVDDNRGNHVVTDLNEINMGWETELFTFQHRFNEDNHQRAEDLVLRVFSGESAANKAVKEFNLMKKLLMVGYPVPPVYHIDESGDVIGKPFIIMKRINGKTLDDAYKDESVEVIMKGVSRLMRLFVRLHSIDVSVFRGESYLSSRDSIERQIGFFESVRDNAAPWMAPVLDWIYENKPSDTSEYQSICHMDFHGMNVMIDSDDRSYVIDWGASGIADSRLDLAWTVLLYTTFGGSIFYNPLIDTYREMGGRIESLKFFEVVAAARRISDLMSVISNDGSTGLKPDVLKLMREQKDHFIKVHDFLEERTGIRLVELDAFLADF